MKPTKTLEKTQNAAVLSEALANTMAHLDLSQDFVGKVLGINRDSVRRGLAKGIDPESKTGELALLLIRVFRSLYAYVGDIDNVKHWLNTENSHLQGQKPLQLMTRLQGLVQVVVYTDAVRGNR